MRTSKLLTTLTILAVVLIFGCNKNEHWGNPFDPSNPDVNLLQIAVNTASPVPLGTAATFAVLGGSTVTNAGISLITGDAGVSPGTELTGFLATNTIVGPGTVTGGGEGTVTGTIYAGGAIAAQAHNDAQIAFDYLMAQLPVTTTFGEVQQLNGLTLTPGIYKFPTSADLQADGILYLDFNGDPNALFIFQIGSTLVTKLNSQIIATDNGGSTTCLGPNVYWAVGTSATIDGSSFIGTVIASETITMTSAANTIVVTNVAGRMLALNGAVTMSTDNISVCAGSGGGTKPPKPCRDFVTGGGWIKESFDGHGHKNDKATFGVSGGIKNGNFWGQLSYNDHNGVSVKSTEVTGYRYINTTTREIKGFAKVNGQGSFAYIVVVADNGEPGHKPGSNKDSFSLKLENGYSASGTLDGGNIQLHFVCGESHDKHDKGDREDYFDKDENDGHHNCNNDNAWRR